MANEEHLAILKKGTKAWNLWRQQNPTVRPELRGVLGYELLTLNSAKSLETDRQPPEDLSGMREYFAHADLTGVDLSATALDGSDLSHLILVAANFRGSTLSGVNFGSSTLRAADFFDAHLRGADFHHADLSAANLTEASLVEADLRMTALTGADFTGAQMLNTILDDIDLSAAKGLDAVRHPGPSTLGIDVIYRSKGLIPESFLRGVGAPESFIVYMRSLVGTPIEFYSCFLSYSSKDQEFAERLHADLQNKGVRCWFAPEDMKIGDRIRPSIDEAIRVHDKLLLVLTENSMKSAWVEKEVETAFEKERRQGRTVLFPIRLDDAVMEAQEAWAADIRRTRHIGDFRDWKGHDSYRNAFERLMRDLKAS